MNRLSWFNTVSLTLGFAFLYIPMLILIIYSFNESKLVTVWAGFSTKWYGELFQNEANPGCRLGDVARCGVLVDNRNRSGHRCRLCVGAWGAFLWPDAVFRHDLCAAGDARSDHRPVAAAAVHRHRTGSRVS